MTMSLSSHLPNPLPTITAKQFVCKMWNCPLTCKQSKAVLTILGDLDWHASSNGKKYLSAAIKLTCVLGKGKADDVLFLSSAAGCLAIKQTDHMINL